MTTKTNVSKKEADSKPEMMMYKCSQCGASFRSDIKPAFCPNCGSSKCLGKPYIPPKED